MQSVLLAINTARQTYLISVTPYHKHSHTCLIDNIEHWQDWISTNLWCDTPFDDNWHSVTGYQVNANINRFKNEENLSFTHLSTIPTQSTNPSVSHIWMEELAIFVNDIALQGDYLLCHQSSKTNPQASKKVRLLPSKLTTASKPKSSKPKPKQRPTTDAVSQPRRYISFSLTINRRDVRLQMTLMILALTTTTLRRGGKRPSRRSGITHRWNHRVWRLAISTACTI